jgi:uncharacterized membrane protein
MDLTSIIFSTDPIFNALSILAVVFWGYIFYSLFIKNKEKLSEVERVINIFALGIFFVSVSTVIFGNSQLIIAELVAISSLLIFFYRLAFRLYQERKNNP